MSYLTEAFKQLNIIDEDLFPTDSEGLNKLKDFMKSDIDDEDLIVYDDTANNEDEIKASYDGKVILRCNVCKSYFFKEPKSVIIDAEAGLANVGDECCYCHNDMGYNVVGVVAPYVADVSKEERAEDAHGEPAEVDVEVDDIDVKPEDVNESIKKINESDATVGDAYDQLNKCYGRCNIAFKYDSGEEAVNFHKVVVNWANKNRKRVIKLNAATLELEDIVPGIDSTTGKRVESDILKRLKVEGGRSIIYIEDIDRISDDVRYYIGELVRDIPGHVIATAYDKSKVDASIASRFVWLDTINESLKKKVSPKVREFVDVINDEMLGNGRYGPFGPIYNADDFYNEFYKSYKFVSGDDGENDTFFEYHHDEIYKAWLDTVDIDEYNEGHANEDDEDLDESLKNVDEAMPYDNVRKVLDKLPRDAKKSNSINQQRKPVDDSNWRKVRKVLDNDVVNEDLKDVSITTDDTKIQMTSEENGKVTVTTEPVKSELDVEDSEVIKPLSAADKDVIANNDGEDGEEVLDDIAIDFDEINDEDLDKLGEKYFTKVYDNVKSFKSTACKLDESGVTLEGKITFKSGKEAKTAFNFNEAYVTKTGKVKLVGENAQFAKNKKAFTLTGSLDNKKLVVESFTYNYRTKDEKTGKSTRLYGTVSK